ncbi:MULTISPECIES: copper chaperone PCu(A)C [Pseudomonas]|uniref:Putative exported protein n=1 Tax=Pseudomonas fluorescens (strain Pf0-1) TaxID=205922 RepID=Q3KE56_PSEPF|nr:MULTISPECIES: copper chaperone PCu(A)C [Pseudomonas]ABA73950.1 putative exported protein [Pseudomonas fluorescens Pf0-1]MBL0795156.1 copper chaperone PCu(A)C [Pseudomonas sp. B7]MBX8624567.1 copper chaperone PCu(A)C [Pseudomonas glycinae]MBY9027226.1 copper chaperone PCu(A)C [Pseudomonas fluorescens]MBY9033103.1 copper chaperone PCu(A)C [Pseudomonas fluorescens]
MNPFLNHIKRAALGLSLLGLAFQVSAQTKVDDAWVRATVPNQSASGAFMTVTADSDSKLLSVASPAAKDVQIHEMTMKNDVMSMGPVKSVDLPAGKAINFDPNGYHVMLMGLSAQLKEGDSVPLTLTIENAKGEKETVEVKAPVKALTMEGHDHSKMH